MYYEMRTMMNDGKMEITQQIPVHATQTFTTYEDFQREVEVKVFEGERPFTKDNNKLGSFILTGLPHVLKGIPQIEVTFDIDSNGILTVSAVENSTGKEAEITVVNDKSKQMKEWRNGGMEKENVKV